MNGPAPAARRAGAVPIPIKVRDYHVSGTFAQVGREKSAALAWKAEEMSGNRRVRRLESVISRHEMLARFGTLAKALLGVPLTLVGPPVLALLIQGFLWHEWDYQVALWRVMVCASLAIVPALIWTEVWRGERFLVEASQGAPPVAGLFTPMSNYHAAMLGIGPAAILANRERFFASVVEILLTGPRLLVGAFREFRLAHRLGRADTTRSARLLAALLARKEGVALKSLQRPGEPLERVLRALNQLIRLGWAGVSARESRVYVYTKARRMLEQALGERWRAA